MQHENSQLLGRYTQIIQIINLKPDKETLYTHKNSNHAPRIPTSIEKRICTFSSNKNRFKESKIICQKRLILHIAMDIAYEI